MSSVCMVSLGFSKIRGVGDTFVIIPGTRYAMESLFFYLQYPCNVRPDRYAVLSFFIWGAGGEGALVMFAHERAAVNSLEWLIFMLMHYYWSP